MENIHEIDIKSKHVIVKTKNELCPDPEDSVFFCRFGFGCDPKALGSKVYGYFLTEGKNTCICRTGVIRLASEDEVNRAIAKATKLCITIPPKG